MRVRQIELKQFRNYGQQSITVEPGINVFYGDNAQGKTNILEAVYLCACARSHRTARDAEMIRHQADRYAVRLEFISQNGTEEELLLEFQESSTHDPNRGHSIRTVRHNGIRLEKISEMMGLFHAVIFAPEDLMLVKEGPATRRRYLDLLISQVRPSYFLNLQQYSRYLQQRNKLLKDLRIAHSGRAGELNEETRLHLEVWNQALAAQAAGLIEQRQQYCRRIADLAGQAQEKISAGKEKLYVKYRTVSGIKPEMTRAQIEALYYQKLNTLLQEDLEKGTTSQGPHRDDLELSLDGDGLKPFASQGQQRSAVLSLKLAELAILRQDTGEAPVLLLDDVMSELDEGRRASLLENIQDAQVFVTCTDAQQVVREIRHELKETEHTSQLAGNRFTYYRVSQGTVFRDGV
ncbi:MAG TPA: DNA replication/repair protein RecF [Clostridiales bacterium]|nr:DNA replication/repair protein RecF [Clostridiales bacterium]